MKIKDFTPENRPMERMIENKLITSENIKYKIHMIRNKQIMLDSDLAQLYGISTKILNQAVKRNKDKFPEDFMFQLTNIEFESLRSQIVTLDKGRGSHRKYLPFVFTEHGILSLAGILKSGIATNINIKIIRTFVSMRKFISRNIRLFARLDLVERKQIDYQLKTDTNFRNIYKIIESKDLIPKQGIFFDGQIFDAHKFVSDLLRSAKKSIILIDNYVDESVLVLFTKINVVVTIYTERITPQLELDLKKYNEQYNKITIKELKKSHDRFLIIDNEKIFHIGASIKDLGKKWCAFSKLNKINLNILNRLE